MPPAHPADNEDGDYVSGEDSDFAPDVATVEESESEDSGDEVAGEVNQQKRKSKPQKRKSKGEEEAEDAGIENSGDEAIIERGLKKGRKQRKERGSEDGDEGGEGGLIKTRRQRALEKEEKKILTDVRAPTVDIDAIWVRMKAGAPPPKPTALDEPMEEMIDTSSEVQKGKEPEGAQGRSGLNDDPRAMILIKRTYTFAGKTQTEEKLVPRNSAEAKLFLSSQAAESPQPPPPPIDAIPPTDPSEPTKPRPPKAFRSRFEPVVDLPIREDLNFGVRARAQAPVKKWGEVEDKGKKLNTVEKSALDWAGYVDQEGIGDELAQAGKAKGAYKERQSFLARVEGKRDVEERRARGLPV